MESKRVMEIFISGADRGLGLGMVRELLQAGNRIFAGQFMKEWQELDALKEEYGEQLILLPLDVSDTDSVREVIKLLLERTDRLDMLISNAGIFEKDNGNNDPMNTDYDYMMKQYSVNAVSAVRLTEGLYPFLQKSNVKKICFVSSEAGSITQAQRKESFGYCMSKAALNMYGKLLHNRLASEGYEIKLYHPGWIKSYMSGVLSGQGNLTIEEAAKIAVNFFLEKSNTNGELRMVGYDGEVFEF